jgi:hypothetical protein
MQTKIIFHDYFIKVGCTKIIHIIGLKLICLIIIYHILSFPVCSIISKSSTILSYTIVLLPVNWVIKVLLPLPVWWECDVVNTILLSNSSPHFHSLLVVLALFPSPSFLNYGWNVLITILLLFLQNSIQSKFGLTPYIKHYQFGFD